MKSLSIFTMLIGLVFLSFALFSSGNSKIIEYTVENNRKLENDFNTSGKYIDSFKVKNGRLPSQKEFENRNITSDESHRSLQIRIVYDAAKIIDINGDLEKFGPPPAEYYILSIWRGEWNSLYASWTDSTSLGLQTSEFYLFGSALKDALLFIFLFLISAMTSIWLWLKSTHRKREKNG